MTLISTAESFAREHGLTIAGMYELDGDLAVTFADNGRLLKEVWLVDLDRAKDRLLEWLDEVMPPLEEPPVKPPEDARLPRVLGALDRLTRAMEEIGGFLRMPHQYALAEAQEVLEQEGVRAKRVQGEWVDRG